MIIHSKVDLITNLYVAINSACGVGCHQKCVSSCASTCTGSPGAYADEAESIVSITATIFGIELQKQLEAEGRDIPLLVEKCIKAVEARGRLAMGVTLVNISRDVRYILMVIAVLL